MSERTPGQKASRFWKTGIVTWPLFMFTQKYQSSWFHTKTDELYLLFSVNSIFFLIIQPIWPISCTWFGAAVLQIQFCRRMLGLNPVLRSRKYFFRLRRAVNLNYGSGSCSVRYPSPFWTYVVSNLKKHFLHFLISKKNKNKISAFFSNYDFFSINFFKSLIKKKDLEQDPEP